MLAQLVCGCNISTYQYCVMCCLMRFYFQWIHLTNFGAPLYQPYRAKRECSNPFDAAYSYKKIRLLLQSNLARDSHHEHHFLSPSGDHCGSNLSGSSRRMAGCTKVFKTCQTRNIQEGCPSWILGMVPTTTILPNKTPH